MGQSLRANGESDLDRELSDLVALVVRQRASTRAELARWTGLARSTISQRVDRLLELGILIEAGGGLSSGGRPPMMLDINPAAGTLLAADLGASHARLAAASLSGQLEIERSFDIDIASGPGSVLTWVVGQFRELLRECGRDETDVRAIGVGVPGPVEFAAGTVVRPPIMPGWDGVSIREILSEDFAVPILVDNDVNIMGLGEYWSRGFAHEQMLFIKVATGIGCGIVTEGHVHRGADGAAGDIGHVRVPARNDVVCTCGNVNCLEAVASGAAIARQLREEGIDARGPDDVVRLAQAGNGAALRFVRVAAQSIGEVLAMLVNFYNPSHIVLGGALAVLRDDLLAGIRGVVYQRALPLATRHLSIDATAFESRAGVLGATILATEGALSPIGLSDWATRGTSLPRSEARFAAGN